MAELWVNYELRFHVSIWQKVTSASYPWSSETTSWESISKPGCGDRPAPLYGILSWIPRRMATARSPTASWNQPRQTPFQLQMPSLRRLAVNTEDCSSARCSCWTNNLFYIDLYQCGSECQDDEDTYNNSTMKLMMKMMVTTCKDSLVA